MKFYKTIRKIHYYISWVIAVPFFLVCITGTLLIFRHHSESIQPQKVATGHAEISVGFEKIYEIAKSVQQAQITSPTDISKVVLRPSRGLVEVFLKKNNYHIQLDGRTGQVLKVGPRYTSLLIRLHEGVYFSKAVRDYVFAPSAIFMLLLWLTGSILLFRIWKRR